MSISENIRSFFAGINNIVAVYLFGSHAAGKAHVSSDVDVAVLFGHRDRETINRQLDEFLLALSRRLRKNVHLVAMDFSGEALLKQIFQRGTCLVVHDPKKLAVFKMSAFSKIVHFHFYHRRMQAGLARRVMEGAPRGGS